MIDVDLADHDGGRYESLALRMARHPSESAEYFIARLLAYCLEYQDGISFSRGLSDPEEPTIAVRDLTGAVQVWVEIGAPDASRLHKASKAARRVVVYTHRDPVPLLRQLAGERIHRASEIELFSLDRSLVASLAARLDRRMALSLSVSDRRLLIALDDLVVEGALTRHELA